MNKTLAALAVLAVLSGSMWFLGASHVQKKWDIEKARLQTEADLAKKQDVDARRAVEEQHKKDIEYAKSQAGRAAIAAWLKSHSLLPNGSPVPGPGGGQTQGSGGADAATCQCGTGGDVEGFALRCGEDALTVEAWQDWAKREGLETE